MRANVLVFPDSYGLEWWFNVVVKFDGGTSWGIGVVVQ
jgi:hypothetical protein